MFWRPVIRFYAFVHLKLKKTLKRELDQVLVLQRGWFPFFASDSVYDEPVSGTIRDRDRIPRRFVRIFHADNPRVFRRHYRLKKREKEKERRRHDEGKRGVRFEDEKRTSDTLFSFGCSAFSKCGHSLLDVVIKNER